MHIRTLLRSPPPWPHSCMHLPFSQTSACVCTHEHAAEPLLVRRRHSNPNDRIYHHSIPSNIASEPTPSLPSCPRHKQSSPQPYSTDGFPQPCSTEGVPSSTAAMASTRCKAHSWGRLLDLRAITAACGRSQEQRGLSWGNAMTMMTIMAVMMRVHYRSASSSLCVCDSQGSCPGIWAGIGDKRGILDIGQ